MNCIHCMWTSDLYYTTSEINGRTLTIVSHLQLRPTWPKWLWEDHTVALHCGQPDG